MVLIYTRCQFPWASVTKYHEVGGSFLFDFFWRSWHHEPCRILVPQPGIEPVSPASGARSLNHWTPGKSQELSHSFGGQKSGDGRATHPLKPLGKSPSLGYLLLVPQMFLGLQLCITPISASDFTCHLLVRIPVLLNQGPILRRY